MSKRSFIRAGKKMLATLVSAAMVVAFTPVVALADEGEIGTETNPYIVSNETELRTAINNGGNIKLSQNIDVSSSIEIVKTTTLDLNKFTLTSTYNGAGEEGSTIHLGSNSEESTTLTIKNGIVVANNYSSVSTGVMCVEAGRTLNVADVSFTTNGTAFYPKGSILNIARCDIKAEGYCIATNASSPSNYYVTIKVSDSTITGGDGAGTAICFNVPGSLDINSCEINGYFQGLIVRGGTATINNSTITNTMDADTYSSYFANRNWGEGNTVNLAALTVGNKVADESTSYQYPTSVTLKNTKVVSAGNAANAFPAVYSWANKDAENGVSFSSDENCTFDGNICFDGPDGNARNTTVSMAGGTVTDVNDTVKYSTSGSTITLLKDITEGIAIPAGKTIELDLADHNISSTSGHAITNSGTLIIWGDGTVDCKAHEKAAIQNNAGAVLCLNGGTYTRSEENGAGETTPGGSGTNGGNSYYTISNQGTLNINEGVKVENKGSYSSMIENGWQTPVNNTNEVYAELNIYGGSFNGGKFTVKNDDYGKLLIEDGEFINTYSLGATLLNWNVANITGGTFTSKYTVFSNRTVASDRPAYEAGTLGISGGKFTCDTAIATNVNGSISISAGTFNLDPQNYLAGGYIARVNTSDYTVVADSELYEGTYTTQPTSLKAGCSAELDTATGYYTITHTCSYSVYSTMQPTCTEAGITTYKCDICGATKTESIAALGHVYGAYVVTTAPTETSTGVATSTCSRCGATQTTVLDKLEPAGSDTTATGEDGSKVDVVINTNPSGTGSDATNGTVTYTGPAEGSTATSVSIPATVTIGGNTYDVTSIASDAFADNSTVTSVTIPSTVTSIGESAFENCTALESVTVPAGVTTVAESTFAGCSSLATLEIKGSVTEIADSAFEGCSALTTISVPSTVTKIGESAFAGCSSLTTISVPAGVTEIATSTFADCTSLGTVELKGSVTAIASSAFEGCSSLTGIEIPSTVTEIGDKAFANSGLATIALPSGVKIIEKSTFAGCSNLTYATMQGSITEIGEKAFENCSSLKTIAIPSSVKTIGASAFEGCSSLNSVAIPGGSGSAITTMATGSSTAGVTVVGKRAFAKSGVTAVSIGKNVQLGTGVFRDCAKLKTATVKAATLPTYAFKGCTALKSVSLAKGVTTIKRGVFSGCKKLTGVVLPSSVTSIAKYAFYGASKVKTLTVNSKSLTKSGVKNALKGSSVTTVKCPKKVLAAYKKFFTKANCGKSAITVKAI